MSMLTTGTRLKSSVCATEVMVVSAPEIEVALTCGGAPMRDAAAGATDAAGAEGVAPEWADGTQMGKRYVSEDGALELLCVKGGDGSLAVNGEALALKDGRKLPKTD